MRLIEVEAFLDRERLIKEGKSVDRRKNVLEFGDDGVKEYAILSHRWVEQKEVDYCEMVKFAKMAMEERDEIRQRDGYQKILQSCKQAQKDGYEWLWVDTCCIDKRSSAELSEAINSMYRWYENARVCYAYLHDVSASSFPTARDEERYPKFKGWPEWFSRGWTLQELIAPSNVQFFNKDWQSIGYKRILAPVLRNITGILEHILIHGLRGNRPCVAQIMSWAANRTTTRVEDGAYSLMGLLDVNMSMLYGEGKKAFHRLQLEIIRASNDQSIFAWDCNVRTGSILADDSSYFRDCGTMELMAHDEYIQFLKKEIPEEELDSIEDRLGTFPVTNRGIQIWLFLRPHPGSCTRFEAWLCRYDRWDAPVTINLVLWESDYYASPFISPQYLGYEAPKWQLRQVYLRYQDPPHRNITFEIDDSALTENGFTCCNAYPKEFTGNALTLTTTNPLCVKVYSDSSTKHRFVVGFGQSFGRDWIHVVSDDNTTLHHSWENYTYIEMLARAPEHAQAMHKACSGSEPYGQVRIMQTRLPQTTGILQTSSVMWKSSRMCGVKLDVLHDLGFGDVSGEWTVFDVDGTDDPDCDWRCLMMFDRSRKYDGYQIDGVPSNFSATPDGIKLGDYGHFTDSEEFCCQGNLFADLESLSLMADITPRQYQISSTGEVLAFDPSNFNILALYKPLMLSLPCNDDLKSLLTSCSTRLTNRYLVTRIIQCPRPYDACSNITTPLCSIAKPFVWHRNESAGSMSEERSGDDRENSTFIYRYKQTDVLRHGARRL